MNSKSNEVHTMLVVYFISKSHQSNIKKIKSNNGSQNLFYLSFDTCFATSFATCFARRGRGRGRGRVPQSRTCRIAKQRYSMSSKNSFYLSYDTCFATCFARRGRVPQSRTCRTAASRSRYSLRGQKNRNRSRTPWYESLLLHHLLHHPSHLQIINTCR
jgi:hypothetical protein